MRLVGQNLLLFRGSVGVIKHRYKTAQPYESSKIGEKHEIAKYAFFILTKYTQTHFVL